MVTQIALQAAHGIFQLVQQLRTELLTLIIGTGNLHVQRFDAGFERMNGVLILFCGSLECFQLLLQFCLLFGRIEICYGPQTLELGIMLSVLAF